MTASTAARPASPVRTRQATPEERVPGALIQDIGAATRPQPFNPNAPTKDEDEIIDILAHGHEQAKRAARTMVTWAIYEGEWLTHMKGRVKTQKGKWLGWLADHRDQLGFGEDSAENYMRIARHKESESVRNATSMNDALRGASSPSNAAAPARSRRSRGGTGTPGPTRRRAACRTRRPRRTTSSSNTSCRGNRTPSIPSGSCARSKASTSRPTGSVASSRPSSTPVGALRPIEEAIELAEEFAPRYSPWSTEGESVIR